MHLRLLSTIEDARTGVTKIMSKNLSVIELR